MDETAESETSTEDPEVSVSQRGSQHGHGGDDHDQAKPAALVGVPLNPTEQLAQALQRLLKKKDNGDTSSWCSARGPQRGVRFRGGTAPSPPTWKYVPGDLRSFDRFEHKVKVWQLQMILQLA